MKSINLVVMIRAEGLLEDRHERQNRAGCQTSVRSGLAMLIATITAYLISLGAYDARAQPIAFFQTLYTFTNGADGAAPDGVVLSGTTLYGTAGYGTTGNGTVFAVNADGTDFRVLHTFGELFYADQGFQRTNLDGAEPYGGLVLSNNTLYGTTLEGGTVGYGTVFAVNTDGTGFTTVHNFTGADGGGGVRGIVNAWQHSLRNVPTRLSYVRRKCLCREF